MKNGRLIAVSAIVTALTVVMLTLGAYFPTFDLSALFTSALIIMLPLSKKSPKSAMLTWLASGILSLIFTTSRFYVSVLYLAFFGIHPIINYFQQNSNRNLKFLYVVKAVWFIGTCFLMYYAFSMFVTEAYFLKEYIPIVIVLLGLILYIIYDIVLIKFQKMTDGIIKKLGL